jgi:hypothetical protein
MKTQGKPLSYKMYRTTYLRALIDLYILLDEKP